MRLFLAIELSEELRRWSAELSTQLRRQRELSDCSWVRTENLHVTLKFFGEVPDTKAAEICDALKGLDHPAFELKPSGLELLPPRGPVRVIALGLTGDLDTLNELHQELEIRCKSIGFPAEARRFRPHVTLARARRPLPPRVRKQLQNVAIDSRPLEGLTIGQIVLMESRLKPDAAQYAPLAHFPLRPSDGG
jgi:2'-5' RNA ligase